MTTRNNTIGKNLKPGIYFLKAKGCPPAISRAGKPVKFVEIEQIRKKGEV